MLSLRELTRRSEGHKGFDRCYFLDDGTVSLDGDGDREKIMGMTPAQRTAVSALSFKECVALLCNARGTVLYRKVPKIIRRRWEQQIQPSIINQ